MALVIQCDHCGAHKTDQVSRHYWIHDNICIRPRYNGPTFKRGHHSVQIHEFNIDACCIDCYEKALLKAIKQNKR